MSASPAGITITVDTRRVVLLLEDCVSLCESMPFMVRWDERGQAIACECCGTPVALVPEAKCSDGPGRRHRPAIWEEENARKHTQRRCEWIRENGDPMETG